MTATMPTGQQVPDVATVLKRVDDRLARRAGDDPLPAETLTEFGRAVQAQIVEPLLAGAPAAAVPAAEVEELRAELAEVQRAAKASADLAAYWEREHQNTVLPYTTKIEQERDEARRQLEATREENVRLQRELDAARRDAVARATSLERHLAEAATRRDQLADEVASLRERDERSSSDGERHRHHYPVRQPGELPQPCACGKPYPRAHLAEPRESLASAPDPWDELFAGIRTDLADWNPKGAKK